MSKRFEIGASKRKLKTKKIGFYARCIEKTILSINYNKVHADLSYYRGSKMI